MKRFIVLALAATLSAAALAGNWQSSYIGGLSAAKARNWTEARADFKTASKQRPGDSQSISLPGSVFQQTEWRQGAPYSPDFLAAYCGLKAAIEMSTSDARATLLSQVKAEFENLASRRDFCPELFFFLDETYVLTGQTDKRVALGKQYAEVGTKADWKVDSEGIAPEDVEMVGELPAPGAPYQPVVTPDQAPQVHLTTLLTKPMIPSADKSMDAKTVIVIHTSPAPKNASSSKRQDKSALWPELKSPSENVVFHSSASTERPTKTKPSSPTVSQVSPSKAATRSPGFGVQTSTKTSIAQQSTPDAGLELLLAKVQEQTKSIDQIDSPNQPPTTTQTSPQVSQQTTTGDAPKPLKEKPVRRHKEKKPKTHPVQADSEPIQTTATPAQSQTTDHRSVAIVKPISVKALSHSKKVTPPSATTAALAAVPALDTKFAIVIGNSESKMDGASLPFAADDAQKLRQSLITDGGYEDSNVEVVVNATAAQIADSVNALASRVPDKGAVFIYFTGAGVNLDGKDFLAGVDSNSADDSSTMIAKDDVYRAFMTRGARIFAFYQVSRPLQQGHFFGSELPLVGSISQMQATLPGEAVYAINSDGKQVGLFTEAFASVLRDIRSNQTPIMEFGWQVFYKLRSGGTGAEGGSSNQSPSLPVLTNMTADARF